MKRHRVDDGDGTAPRPSSFASQTGRDGHTVGVGVVVGAGGTAGPDGGTDSSVTRPVLEVPGVPVDTAVLLAEAIRRTKSVFGHEEKALLWTPPEERDDVLYGGSSLVVEGSVQGGVGDMNSPDGVLDGVLSRVGAASRLNPSLERQRVKQEERMDKMRVAQDDWMKALMRYRPPSSSSPSSPSSVSVSVRGPNHSSPSTSTTGFHERSVSVPTACLLFLWGFQDHGKVSVRRASLYLCGQVLYRFEECRERWVSDRKLLLDWIEHVSSSSSSSSLSRQSSPSSSDGSDVVVWQKEALYWVDLLCVSFPWIIPLKVGLRMMQQRCPAGIQIDSDTRPGVYDGGVDDVDMAGRGGNVGLDGRSMISWRQLRDVGIRYGDRECRVVERLVDRADRAMLVLMPRIGDDVDDDDIDEGRSNGKSDAASHTGNDDDDDDDDDIDWEEGDEDDAADAHVDAVERTLSVMASTGALCGGQMSVRLEGKEEEGEGCHLGDHMQDGQRFGEGHGGQTPSFIDGSSQGASLANDERATKARRRLEKAVSSLVMKHLPRLSAWVSGLMNADSLRSNHHQQQEKHTQSSLSTSLVSMSIEESRAHSRMLERLVDLKALVAKTITAAAKLGIGTGTAMASLSGSSRTRNTHNNSGIGDGGVVVSSIRPVVVRSESTRSRQQLHHVRSIERRRHDRSRLSRKRSTTIQIKYRK